MKRFVLTSVVALAVVAAFVVSRPAAVPADREVARLQAHFDVLDRQLRNADVSQLTPAQRQARARMIGWLREYRDGGAFPRNDRVAGYLPIFRDSRGVLCAMAYLIERSGHGDLVDRIARTQNYAYLPALAGDEDLVAWLEGAGLTLAEASRVQPDYDGSAGRDRYSSESHSYIATSVVLDIASLVTVAFNSQDTATRSTAWWGILAGTASTLHGLGEIDGDSPKRDVAWANVAIGALTLASTRHGFAESPRRAAAPGLQLGPALFPETASAPQVGLLLTARF